MLLNLVIVICAVLGFVYFIFSYLAKQRIAGSPDLAAQAVPGAERSLLTSALEQGARR